MSPINAFLILNWPALLLSNIRVGVIKNIKPVLIVCTKYDACYPEWLRALLLSKKQFAFLVSQKLWQIASEGIEEKSEFLTRFVREDESPARVITIIENDFLKNNSVRSVFFLNYSHFRKVLVKKALSQFFWNPLKYKINGISQPSICLYSREHLKDYLNYIIVHIIYVILAWRADPGGFLSFEDRIINFVKKFPWLRNRPIKCPEPYEPALISRNFPVVEDRNPSSILFFGNHMKRKGLIWALHALKEWQKPLRVIIAGKCQGLQRIEAQIEELPPQIECEIIPHYVSAREKEIFYRRCSAVILPYQLLFGSSGVVLDAICFRKPLLISNCGSFSAGLENGIGVTYKPLDRRDFLQKLERVLQMGDITQQKAFNFLGRHGIERFSGAILHHTEIDIC